MKMVSTMDRWKGKVAIVTGASSGIGAAVTKKLLEAGLIVVGFDKNVDDSKTTFDAKEKLVFVNVDVTNEENVLKAFKWTTENVGPVHILVNSAGIVARERVIDGDTENLRKVLDVNVLGVCIATKQAIKIMKENNIDGHVILLNSIYGHKINRVGTSIYAASKHAITALTEILRLELNSLNSRIKVTSISPGFLDTPIQDEVARANEQFKLYIANNLLKPEDVADAIVYAISTPPHVQIQELTIKHVNEHF